MTSSVRFDTLCINDVRGYLGAPVHKRLKTRMQHHKGINDHRLKKATVELVHARVEVLEGLFCQPFAAVHSAIKAADDLRAAREISTWESGVCFDSQ